MLYLHNDTLSGSIVGVGLLLKKGSLVSGPPFIHLIITVFTF
jgi:hypothetical protein